MEKKLSNPDNQNDIQLADAAYNPFPSFDKWKDISLETVRWERYSELIKVRKEVPPEVLNRARQIVKRAAAVETGAIEGLYDVDRGFTFTVATEAATWQASVKAKGSDTTSLIESQLHAYDFVLDFATQVVPIVEAWIRQLHKEICSGQSSYMVHTEIGQQIHELPLGEYKNHPNHVRTPQGTIHSYAPVGITSSEMGRFCQELHSVGFSNAHPVIQAAYSHFCLVAIHPFADGNGRVARALASVFTYRSHSVPLLILVEHRKEYFSALSMADEGHYQTFVDFILDRTLDAMQLVHESFRAAKLPQLTDSLQTLRRLYVTSGGYTYAEVDKAASTLLNLVASELNRLAQEHNVPGQFAMSPSFTHTQYQPINPLYRMPVNVGSGNALNITFSAFEPAHKNIQYTFTVHVPIDCGIHDDIILMDIQSKETFGVRVNELLPNPAPSVQMRIKILAESIVGENVSQLASEAKEILTKRGYLK